MRTRTSILNKKSYLIIAIVIIVILAFMLLGGGPWTRGGMMYRNNLMDMRYWNWGQILIGFGLGCLVGWLFSRKK